MSVLACGGGRGIKMRAAKTRGEQKDSEAEGERLRVISACGASAKSARAWMLSSHAQLIFTFWIFTLPSFHTSERSQALRCCCLPQRRFEYHVFLIQCNHRPAPTTPTPQSPPPNPPLLTFRKYADPHANSTSMHTNHNARAQTSTSTADTCPVMSGGTHTPPAAPHTCPDYPVHGAHIPSLDTTVLPSSPPCPPARSHGIVTSSSKRMCPTM